LDHIRIVLAQMPQMLQEIVRTILCAEPDMEIDTSIVSEREMASSEALRAVDVVILGEAEARTDAYAAVLYAHPHLRLVAINGGRRAFLYELRPHRSPLGEMSPGTLVQAARGQVREGRP
jgi:hypothetical protein